MKNKSSDAFTGLEAAIVLIAFVVVAAVFSYVVLGAGFFTTQKAQETVYKSVEQATSNLQMIGQVYGTVSSPGDTSVKHIQFNLGLGPGAPSMDLSKMIIVVTQPSTNIVKHLVYGTTASDAVFTVTSATPNANQIVNGVIMNQQQAIINFDVSPTIHKNGQITIELRPAEGAALPLSKTAPPDISALQILS
ncbi:MAG: archaellin/type IV pilin N-terminal domain-containing protein [bacterium]